MRTHKNGLTKNSIVVLMSGFRHGSNAEPCMVALFEQRARLISETAELQARLVAGRDRLAICLGHAASPTQGETNPAMPTPTGPNPCQVHDGTEPISIALDTDGSVLHYLPSVSGIDTDPVALASLEASLTAAMAAGKPRDDSSHDSGRAQYYAAEAADGWEANPRWLKAAWPLKTAHLGPVLGMRDAVEAAVIKIMNTSPAPAPAPTPPAPPAPPSSDSSAAAAAAAQLDGRGRLFNSVLVNRYSDGMARIKWHADAEICYGDAATSDIIIGSVSLGADRLFELRRRPINRHERRKFRITLR